MYEAGLHHRICASELVARRRGIPCRSCRHTAALSAEGFEGELQGGRKCSADAMGACCKVRGCLEL